MSNPGPTKEDYDSLIYRLATLETELKDSQRLLEGTKKVSWWKRYWSGVVAVALVVALLLLPSISHALTADQEDLVGLNGVGVLVEGMKPGAERLGLTKDLIRTDVELRLRKAGVRVLTDAERAMAPGMPYLYVNINSQHLPGPVAYSVRVELKEWVTLASGSQTVGAIWDEGEIGTVWARDMRRQLRDSVGDLVDKFINEYLAANPKK